ncbi:MAG: Hsp20/alpha crystallin family protein [Candidatus Marsarchaeota archaeon]|nr:Hsp20/alpha crystallin family protein [Candidatus Marsarchaeota archaeon]
MKEEDRDERYNRWRERRRHMVPWGFDPFDVGRYAMRPFRYMDQFFNEGFDVPKVDLIEEKDSYKVVAELPGVDKKDIKLNVTNDALTIEAGSSAENEKREKNYYFKERSSYGFRRTIQMPEEIKANTSKAKFNNGVLEVTVQKAKQSEGTEVKVE